MYDPQIAACVIEHWAEVLKSQEDESNNCMDIIKVKHFLDSLDIQYFISESLFLYFINEIITITKIDLVKISV